MNAKRMAAAVFAAALGVASVTIDSARAEGTVDDGKALFEGRCTTCHNLERIVQIAGRTPADERAAKWGRFLPSHAAGVDAVGLESLIAYLLSVTVVEP